MNTEQYNCPECDEEFEIPSGNDQIKCPNKECECLIGLDRDFEQENGTWKNLTKVFTFIPRSKVAALRVASNSLVNLIEGPGALRWKAAIPTEPHGGISDDPDFKRLKDTPEWCAFYVAVRNLTK